MRSVDDSEGGVRERRAAEATSADSDRDVLASGCRAPPRGGGPGVVGRGLGVGLEVEVAELREEVSMMQQELLTHRKVLEQFLEVRDGCMAVLGSSQIIADVGDKTAEIELSLAGVSDNTARHGKAISALTDHQKRTQQTLEALVQAVKRLDRSRSRPREGFTAASTLRTSGFMPSERCLVPRAGSTHSSGDELYSPPHASDQPHEVGEAWDDVDEALDGGLWPDEHLDAEVGLRGVGGSEDGEGVGDAWNWSAWSAGLDDRLGMAPSSGGSGADLRPPLPHRRSTDFRARLALQRQRVHAAASYTGHHAGGDMGFDAMDVGIADGLGGAGGDGVPVVGMHQAKMANCVKGVLARIEEALTKLDGADAKGDAAVQPRGRMSGPGVNGGGHGQGVLPEGGRATPLPTPRGPPESWNADASSGRRSGGYTKGQRTPSRPQSSGRRGVKPGAPGQATSATPRRRQRQPGADVGGQWPRDADCAGGPWRPADSWS